MQDTDVVVPSELPVPGEVFSIAEAAQLGRQIGASVQKTADQILKTSELCLVAQQRYGEFGLPVVLGAAKNGKKHVHEVP
jgi:hypothetical protein